MSWINATPAIENDATLSDEARAASLPTDEITAAVRADLQTISHVHPHGVRSSL